MFFNKAFRIGTTQCSVRSDCSYRTLKPAEERFPSLLSLGHDAKSLMGYPLSFYEGVQRNKTTHIICFQIATGTNRTEGEIPSKGG